MFGKVRHLHFVGIGGIGMCGIAEILLNLGYKVSGSDLRENSAVARLRTLGATIYIGHRAEQVAQASVAVFSSAVPKENVELEAARRAGVPVIPRAEMLAELMRLKHGIAVSGSHGKTSTTSMIAALLSNAGLDPTIVVGGRVDSMDSGARVGTGRFLVTEADESDGSFNKLSPTVAVVTSIDREHMDHYGEMEGLYAAFADFANKVPFYGSVVLCLDDAGCQALLAKVRKRIVTYGISAQAHFRATAMKLGAFEASYDLVVEGSLYGRVILKVGGMHNVLNSLAAAAVGVELGLAPQRILDGLKRYQGVDRRFQRRGEVGGILVVDDYGHHPTEIRATLSGASLLGRRILTLFQPHRYSRTADLFDQFAGAFHLADFLTILDVYPAGEKPIPGIDAPSLVAAILRHGHRHCQYSPERKSAVDKICSLARNGDLVLLLGAGDITGLADDLLSRLKEMHPRGRAKGGP